MYSIESIYKSLIKQVSLIITQATTAGVTTDMQYQAWDSRGSVTELPNTDLIGLVNWSYEENEGLPVIQAGILVSLINDMNSFREVKIMDIIRNQFIGPLGDYKTVALLDVDTGVEYGVLQVSGFEIMPAGRSEIRSTRNVALELIRAHGD